MKEEKKFKLLSEKSKLFEVDNKLAKRDGVEIEKGVILTSSFLEENENLLKKYLNFFTAYPDLFLDMIKSTDTELQLFFYQRIMLRALMRYKEIYWTAGRATSKSFLSILAMFLQCVFMPDTKRFLVAPHKNQAATITKQKIQEIYRH